MRRKEKLITDQKVLEDTLNQAQVLRLAMCDGDQPYVLPVNFGYAEGRIYIHSAREGRKIEVLARNPKVCFEASVDLELRRPENPQDACGYTMAYRSVIGHGLAEVLSEPRAVRKGLEAIMAHYGPGPFDFKEKALEQVALIRITVQEMSGKQSPA